MGIWLRRISQAFFLTLFILFLFMGDSLWEREHAQITGQVPVPINFFFQIDPLNGLSHLLGNGFLPSTLLWGLLILIPTIFLGRFFCGWICPLGTFQQICHRLFCFNPPLDDIKSNLYRRSFNLKYLVLLFFLVSAFFGSLLVGILQPFSILLRSFCFAIFPGIKFLSDFGFKTLFDNILSALAPTTPAASSSSSVALEIYPLLNLVGESLKRSYQEALIIGILFLALIITSALMPRFFCRYLCPSGALLALLSRFSLVNRLVKKDSCQKCPRCFRFCQGGANEKDMKSWHQSECMLCLNCLYSCKENAVTLQFSGQKPEKKEALITLPEKRLYLSRRQLIITGITSLSLVPLMRTQGGLPERCPPLLIRPPGARPEKEFLARCIRCGQCIRACPLNALQPAGVQLGAEALWTPILNLQYGYCEHFCTHCTLVCPTGALHPITQAVKIGVQTGKPFKIGTAFINRGNCLPWANGTACIVCEEHCPTAPKAIKLKEKKYWALQKNVIKLPSIEPKLCTGCGICQFMCPVKGKPAIYVTNWGESRHPGDLLGSTRR